MDGRRHSNCWCPRRLGDAEGSLSARSCHQAEARKGVKDARSAPSRSVIRRESCIRAIVAGNLLHMIVKSGFRDRGLSITIGRHVVPFRPSYASVPQARPVALMNSSQLLEIAVNRGSAADQLGVGAGARVCIEVGRA